MGNVFTYTIIRITQITVSAAIFYVVTMLSACSDNSSTKAIEEIPSQAGDDNQSTDIGTQDSLKPILEPISSSSEVALSSAALSSAAHFSSSQGISSQAGDVILSSSSCLQQPASSSSAPILTAPTTPMPNNGIPYLRITMADTSALALLDVDNSPAYSECLIEIAGNGKYADIPASSGEVRLRGNSTRLWYNKKPYRIKFTEKIEVLGLAANKDWVLLANYRDPTNFMNAITFDMARAMGNFDFVNANRFVEVEINGDYKGLYHLTEQIEQAASRVPVTKDGGMLLVLDQDDGPKLAPNAGNNFSSTVYEMPVAVKYPKNPTFADLSTIQADFAKLEQAIAGGEYATVDSLLDIKTFIDFLIIQELTRNVELEAPRSMFLHKAYVTSKYAFGPVWDFDGGFGYGWDETTKEYFNSVDTRTWILSSSNPSTSPYNTSANKSSNKNFNGPGNFGGYNWDGYGETGFFTNLFANETFLVAYKARWAELSTSLLTTVFANLDTYAAETATAMANDASRWPWPCDGNANNCEGRVSSSGKDYVTAINNLKQWLIARASQYTNIVNNY